MQGEHGFSFHFPESHGCIVVPPVPFRYKLALAARRVAFGVALVGGASFCLAIAPVEFLSAAIPAFMLSLVVLLAK